MALAPTRAKDIMQPTNVHASFPIAGCFKAIADHASHINLDVLAHAVGHS